MIPSGFQEKFSTTTCLIVTLPPLTPYPLGPHLYKELSEVELVEMVSQLPESSTFRSKVREIPLRDGEGDTYIKGTSLPTTASSKESEDGLPSALSSLTFIFMPENTSKYMAVKEGI
jgi:hypothetical protein